MLQALNILENFDLKSMGFNSTRYIHTVYQAMSMAFADRDFYYGDPAVAPEEPMKGLLSKEYRKNVRKLCALTRTMKRSDLAIRIHLKARSILILITSKAGTSSNYTRDRTA
jgi:gamma-glutamyltranspeptidase